MVDEAKNVVYLDLASKLQVEVYLELTALKTILQTRREDYNSEVLIDSYVSTEFDVDQS